MRNRIPTHDTENNRNLNPNWIPASRNFDGERRWIFEGTNPQPHARFVLTESAFGGGFMLTAYVEKSAMCRGMAPPSHGDRWAEIDSWHCESMDVATGRANMLAYEWWRTVSAAPRTTVGVLSAHTAPIPTASAALVGRGVQPVGAGFQVVGGKPSDELADCVSAGRPTRSELSRWAGQLVSIARADGAARHFVVLADADPFAVRHFGQNTRWATVAHAPRTVQESGDILPTLKCRVFEGGDDVPPHGWGWALVAYEGGCARLAGEGLATSLESAILAGVADFSLARAEYESGCHVG